MTSLHVNTVQGVTDTTPPGYVPPLVSNGSLCLLVDYQGGQTQRPYVRMTPGIWWEGRRYGPPRDQFIPFGHFEWQTSIDGKSCGKPAAWTQTLDTHAAVVTCRNRYDNGLSVETAAFTPSGHDLVVLRRRLTTKGPGTQQVRTTLHYQFTPPGKENRLPRRVTGTCAWNEATQCVEYRYQADGHRLCGGVIYVFADKPVTASVDGQAATLSCDVSLDPGKTAETTFYLLFAGSLEGKDYLQRAAALRRLARQEGYDGLHSAHQGAWTAYWDASYVHLPDARLERVYRTAQYHLRANATRWSFPVGIFPTHWAGRFFGWDEMFCYQALVSSNHPELARRCPDFRRAGLKTALYRNSHYGKPGTFGARYPWEALEDGSEAAPPGFWMDHVFHMSNIAQSAWQQYLYTADRDYLTTTGYPVVKECARFFLANMVYEASDGGMFIGKCTDLERLGPARRNPFMTSCGAIYTLEAAAQAAAVLKADKEEATRWKAAAGKLRQSLPHEGDRYVPYAGCQEESVAALGGLFPYPLFDASNTRQKNAAYRFVEKGQRSGNMYPVGKSLCAWYAGWLAAALAVLGDTEQPARLLSKAAEGAGCFAELFEINEPEVSRNPWFSTASGNVVYALNQMLIQCRGERILIAPAVPEAWKDYSFKLACHGNVLAEVAVKNGRLAKLALLPGTAGSSLQRTLVVPQTLLEGVTLNEAVVSKVSTQNECRCLALRFQGPADVVVTGN